MKFIFQNSASLDPRTGLSPLTSLSAPPTPPPRQHYRPTKSLLQFTCHDILLIPHQLLHALLLLLLLLFLTLLQTLVSSSCSSPIINALAPPSSSTLSVKVFLAGWYQTLPLGSKIPFLLWYRHSPKLLIQTLWAERITLWAFIIACQGHISCVIDIFEFYNGCLKFCLIFFTNLTILANLAILKNLVILVNMVIFVNMVMLVNHVILLNLVFFWWFWWSFIK